MSPAEGRCSVMAPATIPDAPTRFAIQAEGLSVARSGRAVLQQVSFGVRPGQVYALLGGNGAGKSTTLLTLLGFLSPSEGQAYVEGLEVPLHLREIRRRMSYLPERATLYPHLSARENLSYFLALAAHRTDETATEEALRSVGLEASTWNQRLSTYSKGMRQKVAIALALLRDTPILLLDEPTSGLDPVAIDELNALVRRVADAGRTILMVTHDVYGACQVADRIGLLRNGRLVGAFEAAEDARIDTEAVHSAFTAEVMT